jgi:thiamine biosynthesis lipoprotein
MTHRRFFVICAWFWGFSLGASRGAEESRFVFEKAEMGLPFRITLYAHQPSLAKAAADAAFARIAELNAVFSDYDPDSELSRLSRTSGRGQAVPVGPDLWRVLEKSQQLAEKTQGAFDLTVGPLVNLWRRVRRKRELPSPALVEEMRARVGYKAVRLDPVARTAELAVADMRLDAGAIAKGYAVDEALAVLDRLGIHRALVGGSGDMAASDPPPGQEGWRIEVPAIDAPGAPPSQVVLLARRAIATSGDHFQYVEIDGVRYSHIVDPRTGVGLIGQSSVTVVAGNCATADSLATAVSVLGPQKGLALVESTPGAAVHWVGREGNAIQSADSPRWAEIARPEEGH